MPPTLCLTVTNSIVGCTLECGIDHTVGLFRMFALIHPCFKASCVIVLGSCKTKWCILCSFQHNIFTRLEMLIFISRIGEEDINDVVDLIFNLIELINRKDFFVGNARRYFTIMLVDVIDKEIYTSENANKIKL